MRSHTGRRAVRGWGVALLRIHAPAAAEPEVRRTPFLRIERHRIPDPLPPPSAVRPTRPQPARPGIDGNAHSLVESLAELVGVTQPSNDTLERLVQHLVLHTTPILEPTSIAHRLELPRDLTDRPVPPQLRRELSLAVKEALQDVVRHAGATLVDLTVRVEYGSLRVSIQDDGRPAFVPSPDGHARGNGLLNMKERMCRLGGRCDVRFLDTGTGVTLELPLDPPAPAVGESGPQGDPATTHPAPIRDGA